MALASIWAARVGVTFDREHPQRRHEPGGLDADASAAGADVPQHAVRRQVELSEHDGADLGLRDQTVAMFERGLVPTPAGGRGRGDAEPGRDEHDDGQRVERVRRPVRRDRCA